MSSRTQRAHNLRYVAMTIVFGLAIYVVLPQVNGLRDSWHMLSHPDFAWIVAAVALTFLTYLAAAGNYFFLSFKRLPYRQLVLIEMAAMFVNRLLPAGIGALGTNYSYLRRRRHSQAQSATMLAANNLIGMVGHFSVVIITLFLYGFDNLRSFNNGWQLTRTEAIAATALLAALAGLLIFNKQRLLRGARDLRKPLRVYATQPHKLTAALISSICLTVCNVLCLMACALALGVHLPFIVILAIFSLGVGVGTVTPTPGGLGGFEAGLFGGFVAYHIDVPTGLAIALLYRLVSFWLPIIAGACAFVIAQERDLII